MARFRILSLDGGGIKGTFTASVAANLEQLTGKRLVDHFDLITGTSTGGIIALGLGLGIEASEILEFYRERGPQIFPQTGVNKVLHRLRHMVLAKYPQSVFRANIERVFRDHKLGDSKCRLVIPAYDCNAGRPQIFKTAHHRRFVNDYRTSMTDVAMATSAAPTYFPAFAATNGQSFVDGGVWANCPTVVGTLEAIFVLGYSASDVEILSIGTTETPFHVSRRARLGGLLSWNSSLVSLLMQGQLDSALCQARIITGKDLTRVNAITRPGRFSLDDSSQIGELHGLGSRKAREAVEAVDTRFLDHRVEPFVPCYDHASSEAPFAKLPAPSEIARRRRRRSLGLARVSDSAAPYKIANISTTGALLETNGALPVGSLIELDVHLENCETIQVTARVVRVQDPRWGVTPGVGVQFVEIDGGAQTRIARYVDEERDVLTSEIAELASA